MIELSSDDSADESDGSAGNIKPAVELGPKETSPSPLSYSIEDEPFSIRPIVIEELHMVQGQIIKVPDHRPARDMLFNEVPTMKGNTKHVFMVRYFNRLSPVIPATHTF